MKKTVSAMIILLTLLSLSSCALPGMTVDFASIHRINLPDTSAERYGSVRETVTTASGYEYTVDTVYSDGKITVYETANGSITAISSDSAYYLSDGVYTALLPCFQTYKDAFSEYMTTIHPLDCDERWQRSAVTEDGVETVVYYRAINPALESEFSEYGLHDGAVLTMTYRLDEATSRFISITYSEEYKGNKKTVCERKFEYGLGFSFDIPSGADASVTIIGETEETYTFLSGCAIGWLGTGNLYRDEAKTDLFIPSSDFPETLYK